MAPSGVRDRGRERVRLAVRGLLREALRDVDLRLCDAVTVLNPLRQPERFDSRGDCVRRYVPELYAIDGPVVHRPWEPRKRSALDYADLVVGHDQAVQALLEVRGERRRMR